ncbi:STAS domain-containing protein [Anaerobaca lacustris]|uniref:STAS domain-containing protein n=1 Tax=Anaerobaca lacustris TaxID=3044600 RepID=A0AAW6U2Z6_9BACT|nr:STAS domain-containing protein [Sedimentisphaerales bacterium M17dextr]
MSETEQTDTRTWQPSDGVLVITLPRHTPNGEALELAGEMAHTQPQRHVIVDFSRTQVMTSSMLSQLMVMERQLDAHDKKLILCSVPDNILRMFTCVGLRSLFLFAENQKAALESLGGARCKTGSV